MRASARWWRSIPRSAPATTPFRSRRSRSRSTSSARSRTTSFPSIKHAGRYARLIPGASLTRLEGGEGHFVFLNVGEKDVSIYGVPLYRDRPGVDRAQVHARLADVIRRFFDAHLPA